MKILVTGGAGYIGSHTCVELIESGYTPIVYDNLSNSSTVALDRVKTITGQEVTFVEGDIRDSETLQQVIKSHKIEAVIHFAGLKAVGESVEKPLMYYDQSIEKVIVWKLMSKLWLV